MGKLELAELSPEDRAVLDAAEKLIRRRFLIGRHHVAAALRAGSGRIYTGLHLESTVDQVNVCAEPTALGAAMVAGESEIQTIVAVRHPKPREANPAPAVIPPCGKCRELIADYGPHAWVMIFAEGRLGKVQITDLLPLRRWKRGGPDAVR